MLNFRFRGVHVFRLVLRVVPKNTSAKSDDFTRHIVNRKYDAVTESIVDLSIVILLGN